MTNSRAVSLPCPGCGCPVRVRIDGERVVWTPVGCPEKCMVYHGVDEKWDVSQAEPPEHQTILDARD